MAKHKVIVSAGYHSAGFNAGTEAKPDTQFRRTGDGPFDLEDADYERLSKLGAVIDYNGPENDGGKLSEDEDDEKEPEKMKAADLQAELKSLGEPSDGKKDELVERLTAARAALAS